MHKGFPRVTKFVLRLVVVLKLSRTVEEVDASAVLVNSKNENQNLLRIYTDILEQVVRLHSI